MGISCRYRLRSLNRWAAGLLMGGLLVVGCASQRDSSLNVTSPRSAVTGHYPNLLVQAGYPAPAVRQKIEEAFHQLFYGNDQQRVYYPAGHNQRGPLGYILDVNNHDVRSEGMSYGMMIAVQMNKQAEFNAIWNWAKSYMYQSNPAHPAYGYFAWSMNTQGQPLDEMPAADGEEYFVTALYFAAARWGNGSGIYNYHQQADALLTTMLHRDKITGTTQRGTMTATSLFSREHNMVRFTPDVVNAEHTDASYHLPAFYEVWARVGPKADRPFWANAARVSRAYFAKNAHPQTGLTSDYGNFDGSPWAAPWYKDSADFRYDSWRSVMNWSFDWAWWGKDAKAVERSNTLQTFFARQGLDNYVALYQRSGKPIGGGQPLGIIAMNATGSMASTDPYNKQFIQALWQQQPPSGQFRYYNGMLYMMALLHLSGEYRAWLPATAG